MFKFLKKKTKNNSHDTQGEKFTTATFKIDGMHCTSCSLNIDGELEDSPGVKSAKTSYAKSEAKVEYDSSKISEVALKKIIEKQGYQVLSRLSGIPPNS